MMSTKENWTPVTTALNQTNENLYSFQQPLFVTVIFISIGVVGTIGNALVCVVIASMLALSRSRSATTNLLILNQAIVDVTTSLILILNYSLPYPRYPKAGVWAEFVCRMWVSPSLMWMLFTVSTYNLCMISLERYIAVAHPMIYSTRFHKRSSVLMILFCWIVAPLLHYYYPIAQNYNDEGVCRKRGDPLMLSTISIVVLVLEFFIPLTIMAVVYTRIVYLLRKHEQRLRAGNTNAPQPRRQCIQFLQQYQLQILQTERRRRLQGNFSQERRCAPSEKARRNVTVTLLAVIIMYIVCWMPNRLTFFKYELGGPLHFSGAWYNSTLTLAYLNMSINPFIYALRYQLFREGFKRLFCCR